MAHTINMPALKAATWALDYATSHLIRTGRARQAERMYAMCGVQVFTVGEVRAMIFLALDQDGDKEMAEEIDSILRNDERFRLTKRVFIDRKELEAMKARDARRGT